MAQFLLQSRDVILMECPNSQPAEVLERTVDELGEPVELRVVTNYMNGRRVVVVRHSSGAISRWTLKLGKQTAEVSVE